MGEIQSPHISQPKPFQVLVTGFGPFGDCDPNPSWLIASSLNNGHLNTLTPASIGGHWVNRHRVRYLRPREPIRVAYAAVDEALDALYAEHRELDLVIHLGQHSLGDFYRLETLGRRDGYQHVPDVDGKTPDGDAHRWDDCPGYLPINLALSSLWKLVRENAPEEAEVQPSNDAGAYLCGYTFYSSLVRSWMEGKKEGQGGEGLPVLFLHVPPGIDAEWVGRGRGMVQALVRAVIGLKLDGKDAKQVQWVASV